MKVYDSVNKTEVEVTEHRVLLTSWHPDQVDV